MAPHRYGRPIFGPFRRTARTGVPADHFPKARHMLERGGRTVALVADGPAVKDRARTAALAALEAFGIDTKKVIGLVQDVDDAIDKLMDELSIPDADDDGDMARLVDGVVARIAFRATPVHHTEVDKAGAWDAGAMTKRIGNDEGTAVIRRMYAWADPDGDPGTKAGYAFPHHDVSSDGTVGAANLKACAAVVAALNGGRGADSSAAWWADRAGVYAHVAAHYADGGTDADDIPALDKMSVARERFAAFQRFSDMGIHPVEAVERLADAAAAKFAETVTGDDDDEIEFPAEDEMDDSMRRGRAGHTSGHASTDRVALGRMGESERRRVDAANEVTDPAALSAMVASALVVMGVEPRPALTAATDTRGNVTPEKWHAYLCVEGVRTDDGRKLAEGACRFPDLPVSLRLLVEDEGGHWGAVTCGRIDMMDRRDVEGTPVIYAEGMFGSDPNGQLAELMVKEQTQRFVSIDPRDITASFVEIAIRREQYDVIVIDDSDYYDDGTAYDSYWEFTDCVIGGATIVAMPALPQAVITLAVQELPWSPVAMAAAPTSITAAGGPLTPPAAWFDNPGFHVGDSRLVRQPDGKYASPLTITEEGRVYGHFCYWGAKHTAFPGRTVNPPRSKSGYAHFLTGVLDVDDGSAVPVGQITMGTGHAPLTRRMPNGRDMPLAPHEVQAHYDGGYGAVQMCDVTVGEDDFGAWFAGALRPGVTDEQVRDFKALGLSGDWREMAGALDLLAILSVPAPGFPIARKALTASGEEYDVTISSDTRIGAHDEHVFAMVAAGVVRKLDPERRMARLEHELDELRRLVRPLALERVRRIVGD